MDLTPLPVLPAEDADAPAVVVVATGPTRRAV
jgi:hypothetical protein